MGRASAVIVWSLLLPAIIAASEPERLLNVRDMYPSISPDGRLLVFESNRSGTSQIYARTLGDEAGDASIKKLTNSEFGAETPVISPDGTKIVLAIYVAEGNNDVFVMNTDGSDLRQLTFGPGYDGHPHWNSDGSRIAFNSDRTTPDRDAAWSDRWHEIFSMSSDGSDLVQHTRCQAVCTYGSISPDATRILYRRVLAEPGLNWALDDTRSNSEIFVANLDGSGEVNVSRNKAFDGWRVWSPGGDIIAFASNRSGPPRTGHIWTVKPNGSGAMQITSGSWSYTQPAWSFDGKSLLAYQFEETGDHEFGSVVRIPLH